MNHFLYLLLFGVLISVVFAVFFDGDNKAKAIHGLKTFGQFVGISLLLAWVFYFIPW
ncbi:MAG: hypothetical protein MUC29_13460 [Pyrinomonadaceae bacterium]|jgi:hypothetical protein|nr:hypothetical protein [Pyrinomonadaceae bacterium]